MCYKEELQIKNTAKLQKKFEEDNIPLFIQRYFVNIKSKLGCINYLVALKDFFLWALDNKVIDKETISDIIPSDFNKIQTEDITLYLEYKEKSGMSPTTLETRKNILRSFWNYLSRCNGCEVRENFFKDVSFDGISSSNNLVKKLPSVEQLNAMEEKIKKRKNEYIKIRNLCVLRVLKGTGLRELELAGLDIEDVFLDDDIPYIKIVGKGKYRAREARIVYLTGSATNALKEWMEYRNKLENINEEAVSAVFVNKNGKRLNEEDIKAIFKNYGCGITPHMIRHWFATVMASTGNIAFAQQQLGHKSDSTTINIYANGVFGMKEILENM